MTQILDNICGEFIDSDAQLAALPPAITIYGSARIPATHADYQKTERLARRLSDAGFAVLSGGGPGIMEAANKGAFAGKSPAVGLNIVLPHEQIPNPYQDLSVTFQHFPPRKAMLVKHAFAFIVMAGGFGTLDELFETLTLVQTGKVKPSPVILVGSEFWQSLMDWMRAQLLHRGLINAQDFELIHIMDNEDEIVDFIQGFYNKHYSA
ncbi:TIGR00730 family Rossman fold protein [Neisseriaceae bacterium B1]